MIHHGPSWIPLITAADVKQGSTGEVNRQPLVKDTYHYISFIVIHCHSMFGFTHPFHFAVFSPFLGGGLLWFFMLGAAFYEASVACEALCLWVGDLRCLGWSQGCVLWL
jgi:hypothetical protein